MKSMQSAMLDRIAAIVEDLGLTPLVKEQWANTGQVFVKTADFSTAIVLSYSYQDSYCTLRLSGIGVESSDYADSPPDFRVKLTERNAVESIDWHALKYDEDSRVAQFFDIFTECCKLGAQVQGQNMTPDSIANLAQSVRYALERGLCDDEIRDAVEEALTDARVSS